MVSGSALLQTVVITSLTTLGTLFAAYYLIQRRKKAIPTRWISVGYVRKLYLYPMKSGGRIELDKGEVTEIGLRQIPKTNSRLHVLTDRAFVVFKEDNNEFRTARTYPNMIKIEITVHDEDHIAIDAPTMRTLYVKIPREGQALRKNIKFWQNSQVSVLDCGDEAAHWLSRFILSADVGLRLGYNDGSVKNDITKTHQKLLEYYKNLSNKSLGLCHDLTSLHLINQASVKELNSRISSTQVFAEQFRPNVIVDGPDLSPYDEDKWDFIRIGDEVVTRNVKECTRCIFTTINPDNCERNKEREPLKTLEKYRMSKGPEKAPVMGVNLEVNRSGIIKLGDPVYVGVSS